MPLTAEKKKGNTAGGAKSVPKVWLWSILTIAGSLIVLSVSFLAFVMNTYDNIYPNVYADGLKLGGLSAEQANQALTQHIREKLSGFSVTAETRGFAHTFTPDNINAEYSASGTAQDAYAVGREGNIFQRALDICKAYFSRVEVVVTPEFKAGRDAVEKQFAILAEQADVPVRQYSYVINEKEIVIQNTANGFIINRSAGTDEILKRFGDLEGGTAVFEPEVIEPETLDIDKLRNLIYKEPKDAYLEAEGEVKIMPHQIGVDFDTDLLRQTLKTDKPEIIVPLIFTEPEITQQEMQDSLFRDQLSSFTTYLSSSNVPRTSNIRKAAAYINKSVLMPGEVFSFNGTVGERTPSRGFQEAGAYLNGRLVPETGGGVCQMSTTTYNAALFANLKIIERNNHSMTVSYVPLGQDAMVNWGTSDLKFENTTPYPMQILAVQSGNYVKVTIMGTKTAEQKVEIERRTLSSSPYKNIERINNSLAPGTTHTVQDGHNGYVVETFRVVKDGTGKVVSREFEAKSSYKKVDNIVDVGPPAPAPSPPEASPTSLEVDTNLN